MGAYAQFEKINNPNPFDKNALLALVPQIRAFSQYEESGLLMVIRALYKIGVTVIVQEYMSTTSIRGASFLIDGKPCIAITDYMKTYATLWFTLLHEICHVLFDFEELQSWEFHFTGEKGSLTADLFNEDRANEFAHERLFPKNKLAYIKPMIKSPSLVNAFAAKNKVHPGIIYSFFCFDEKLKSGKDHYPYYHHLFGKSEQTPYDN
jgi:Zn-dependent peptidase ImmA (M78 family)